MSAIGRWVRSHLFIVFLGLVLTFLIIYPIGTLLYASFRDTPPRPGAPPGTFTLDNFRRVFSPALMQGLRSSVVLGALGTLFAFVLGSSLAWLAARSDVPGRFLVQLAGITPLFIPILVGTLAWSALGSPRAGYLNIMFRDLGIPFTVNVYSAGGVVFLYAMYYAPYVFLFVNSALVLMDPEQEEAAAIHGASRFATLRSITFPLAQPAMLGAGILVFVLMVENFSIAQIIGTQASVDLIPAVIYRLTTTPPPSPTTASAVGVVLTLITFVLIAAQRRILRSKDYSTVQGKGFRPRVVKLGRWGWLGTALAVVYLLLAIVLPYFALLQGALRGQPFIAGFRDFFDFSAFSFDSFVQTFGLASFQLGMRNSLILGVIVAIVGMALHLIVSYTVHRTKRRGRRALEYLTMAPLAMPGLVLGLGFLWAWINLPIPLYGTLWVLAFAFIAKFTPQGYQSISSSINQVHMDLEDSAYMSGASRTRAVWNVTVPLIRTGVFSTMLLLFILSFRELSASILLYTSQTRVMSVVLYETWANGSWPRTAVIGVVYSAVLIVATLIGRRWLNPRHV